MIDWHGQNIRGDQIQIASGDIGLFLNAEGAIFHGNTVFKSHHFLVGASFQNAAFLGKVDFLDCTFGSGTSFEGARFEGESIFSIADSIQMFHL
jgi:hypothetical protein